MRIRTAFSIAASVDLSNDASVTCDATAVGGARRPWTGTETSCQTSAGTCAGGGTFLEAAPSVTKAMCDASADSTGGGPDGIDPDGVADGVFTSGAVYAADEKLVLANTILQSMVVVGSKVGNTLGRL